MKRLRKFLCLPLVDKWLLIKVALLLETIKLGMWLLPFRVLYRILNRVMVTSARLQKSSVSAEKIARGVELVSRHTPGLKTCLNQALAAQVLLLRRNYLARLHIGVVKEEGGEFLAHAWVESGGQVVLGGHELDRYTPLAVLEG